MRGRIGLVALLMIALARVAVLRLRRGGMVALLITLLVLLAIVLLGWRICLSWRRVTLLLRCRVSGLRVLLLRRIALLLISLLRRGITLLLIPLLRRWAAISAVALLRWWRTSIYSVARLLGRCGTAITRPAITLRCGGRRTAVAVTLLALPRHAEWLNSSKDVQKSEGEAWRFPIKGLGRKHELGSFL